MDSKNLNRLQRISGHVSLSANGARASGAFVVYEAKGGVAILTLNAPPVNSLSPERVLAIKNAVEQAQNDSSVRAIVFTGAGNFFVAGADIPYLQTLTRSGATKASIVSGLAGAHKIMDLIESGNKPSVAALNGPAFGGGLELAMACAARIGTKASPCGLPEIKLGIIPGYGGTQRLPRLIGVPAAVKAMLSGKPIAPKKALKMGLIDQLVKKPKDLIPTACKVALAIASGSLPRRITLEANDRLGSKAKGEEAIELARITSKRKAKGTPHPNACLNAIKAGLLHGGRKGLEAEMNEFAPLIQSPSGKALIHMFLATRLSPKVPGLQGVKPGRVKTVAVLGGGTMGAGIVALMLMKGYNVILKEINEKLLFNGVKRVVSTIEGVLRRMRLPSMALEMGMRNLTPTTTYQGFEKADMVIEAIIENIPIKQKVFQELESVCRKDCILATNTSTIDIDLIGKKTQAQGRIVGLHFFSPAHIMPLLEIIRTNSTSKQTLATSIAYAKKIGKTAVTVGNCVGFTANRIFFPYGQAAAFLVDRGVSPYRIDKVLKSIVHMPMGVHEMGDLSGLDIMKHVTKNFLDAYGERCYVSPIVDLMMNSKRLGQKTGVGYYKYKGRKGVPDEKGLLPLLTKAREGKPTITVTDQEIAEMVMYPVVNESCRVLAEGMVIRASDIDVVSITGYGFPAHKGGIMHWAQHQGLKNVSAKLASFSQKYPEARNFFAPCAKLKELAANE